MPRALTLAALLAAAPASAALLNGAEEAAVVPGEPNVGSPLAFALTAGLPDRPLSADLRAVRAVAGYAGFKRDVGSDGSTGPTNGAFSEKDRGFSAAVSYARGWSEHWGWSATLAVSRTTGRIYKLTPFRAPAFGDSRDEGAAAAADLLYDPFGGGGFRLPLAVGVGVWTVSGKRGPLDFVFPAGGSYSGVGNQGEIVETYKGTGPLLNFGAAPQRDWGDFRGILYLYASVGARQPRTAYTETDRTLGVSASASSDAGSLAGAGAALELLYRPWDLALVVAPPLGVRGKDAGTLSAWSLAWSRRW